MRCVHSQPLAFDEFRSLAEFLLRNRRADLFLSSPGFAGHDSHFIAVDPTDELEITENIGRAEISDFAFSDDRPVFGFLGYPYGIHRKGISSNNTARIPMGNARKYKYYFKYRASESVLEIYNVDDDSSVLDILPQGLSTEPVTRHKEAQGRVEFEQWQSRNDYIDGVKRTLEYIRAGYIYQLNLTLEYVARIPAFDARSFFMGLWRTFPAPFYAWYDCGRYQLFSTSPERFLKVDRGKVRSEPIKGTVQFREYLPGLTAKLTDSPKESAELSMIVDMVRNDISQNCRYGSVLVKNHKSVFQVDNLLQMYTLVTGTLKEGKTCVDLLLDAFPGASVTGCPKKKAMEIIDELEPHSREIYCGVFFRVEDETTMDSSITIRSGYYDREDARLHFYAGSGIVADSIPENEYEETVSKAGKFIQTLGSGKGLQGPGS